MSTMNPEVCHMPPNPKDPTCLPNYSIPCYLPQGHDEGPLGTPHTWQAPIKPENRLRWF